MAVPTITAVTPAAGPTGGGDLVRVTGTGFADSVAVLFGGVPAKILVVRHEDAIDVVDLLTPAHAPGTVDVSLRNLDEAGEPVPGEEATLAGAYAFVRAPIVEESDLTRLVRTLLQELKRQVLENVSISVSVEYDDTAADGLNVVAMATLPSIVLSGPRIAENRFFSTNVAHEMVVAGPAGPEVRRNRPPLTVDLAFTITAASDRTVELLNLMAGVATFLNRNRWIEMPRDPAAPAGDAARWEMAIDGEIRTRLDGPNDVRAFTCGLVIRGFDIDEGWPLDVGKVVSETELETDVLPPEATP